jgi:hypothetical protein
MGSRFSSRRSSSGAKISNTVRVFGASRLGKRQEAFLWASFQVACPFGATEPRLNSVTPESIPAPRGF